MCQDAILLAVVCLLVTPSSQSLALTSRTQSWGCGVTLAATCRHVSKRIVCGRDHCAQLSPQHAVLGRRLEDSKKY